MAAIATSPVICARASVPTSKRSNAVRSKAFAAARVARPAVARIVRAEGAGEDDIMTFMSSDKIDVQDKVMANPFAKEFYTSTGFTPFAENLNGRVSMIGFVGAFGGLFGGDFLTQFAASPLAVIVLTGLITAASLVPIVKPESYLPGNAKETIMDAYKGAGLEDVFTTENERLVGRLAMSGIGGLLVLSILF